MEWVRKEGKKKVISSSIKLHGRVRFEAFAMKIQSELERDIGSK